ncbi:hypothetical protein GCM10029964_046130 [Kibdelosporangium lantanae]
MTHTLQLAGHSLRPDHCVVEVTRKPLRHIRFQAIEGTLATDGERSLTLTVDGGPLPAAVPCLGPAVRGPKHPSTEDVVRFDSTRVHGWTFTGRLTVRGAWYDLTLRARVVHTDDDTVVLAAVGRTSRVRVEIAAEFTR